MSITVMPFGLTGASATFQRMMDQLLEGYEDFARSYIDDLLIHSRTWEEHLRQVELVLKRLEKMGLKLKKAKCRFGTTSLKYLGFIISPEGVRADPEKNQG